MSQASLPFFGFSCAARAGGLRWNKSRKGNQPIIFYGLTATSGPAPHYRGLTITLGGTPLDERSARRREFYLTTHSTQKRQASIPSANSNPQSQQTSGRSPTPYTARLLTYRMALTLSLVHLTAWLNTG